MAGESSEQNEILLAENSEEPGEKFMNELLHHREYENADEDDLPQIVEDYIRDLCFLRTNFPLKIKEFLREEHEINRPSMLSRNDEEDTKKAQHLSFIGFDDCESKLADLADIPTISKELHEIAEKIQYISMRREMDLNYTEELLLSNKRKRKVDEGIKDTDVCEYSLIRPNRNHCPSLSTPVSEEKSSKSQSTSKIPIRRKEATPSTPLTTRSSAKRLTRSATRNSASTRKNHARHKIAKELKNDL